jgi:hypothetical protein
MKTRSKVFIGVGVVVLVIVVAIGLASLSTPTVQITAVNLEIEYAGFTGGYFGPSSQSLNGTLSTTAGSTFSYTFTLTSSAVLLTHAINQISLGTPGFTLISVSPSLPYNVSPGGSVTITIVVRAPNTNYNGPLNIVVVTS